MTLTVTDDGGLTDTTTTTADITEAPNTPPVADDDAYTVDEDTTRSVGAPGVLANDTDADGDTLTAVLVDDVTNGTLNLDGDGSFIYVPNANYFGTDTFTYLANDGTDDSNTATVTITVLAVNDHPSPTPDPTRRSRPASSCARWERRPTRSRATRSPTSGTSAHVPPDRRRPDRR